MARGALDRISTSGCLGRSVLFYLVRSIPGGISELGDWLSRGLRGLSPTVDARELRDVPPPAMDVRVVWYAGRRRSADHVGFSAPQAPSI